ncbi:MAG: hypothetical protein IIB38_06750 [Candidatus Hydrogenedentes bacterium]|nr:hypothetical protein [Candidatus Hydrogenedentota bacterium]
MNAQEEQRIAERWVGRIVNTGYFVLGALIFPVVIMALISYFAMVTGQEWLSSLFGNHFGMLLLLSSLAGGVLGVFLRHRLTGIIFGEKGALD